MTMNDRWLTPAETAAWIGISAADLARLRKLGEAPPYTKRGPGGRGQPRYRAADLEAWLAARMKRR